MISAIEERSGASGRTDDPGMRPGSYRRLYRAAERAYSAMDDLRRKRRTYIERIVGSGRNDDGLGPYAPDQTHINSMRFAMYVYTRLLAVEAPQGKFYARSTELKTAAAKLQLATNELAAAIDLGRTVERCIQQAMTSIGVIKTGIDYSDIYARRVPVYRGAGTPYACNVDFDDFIYDAFARNRDEVEFVGNFYRARRDALEDDDSIDQSVVKKIDSSSPGRHPMLGMDERAADITRERSISPDELYDYVDLCDLYTPHTRELLTVSADFGRQLPPLRSIRYDGPDPGPYHLLSFYDVDGQIWPIPPADFWFAWHDLASALMTKLADQALSQARFGLADVRSLGDAEKARSARDGEIIPCVNPQNTVWFNKGGIDNGTIAFLTYCMDMFNKQNWNVEVLAGIGPQSNTLGQDEMINASAGRQVQDMQRRVLNLVKSVLRSLAWPILTDPLVKIDITIPGVDSDSPGYPETYTSASQRGTILDFNVEVHPYSSRTRTPSSQLAAVNQFIQGVAIPLGQMMAQQGVSIDFQAFLDIWSEYAQMPEIKDILKYGTPGTPPDQETRKPPTSRREYIRRSISDTSPSAGRAEMIQQLLAGRNRQGGQQ